MPSRLEQFLQMTTATVYAEPLSEPHITITRLAISSLIEGGVLKPSMRVLDVGCGNGTALECFHSYHIDAMGITLGADVSICQEKGLNVVEMDQNAMTFPDDSFDFIWARHVLEHSPIPLFTLFEYKRILAVEGVIYIEVPAPGTHARHEANPNHYSVLTPFAWTCLFEKAGLHQADTYTELKFPLADSSLDIYYNFFLERRREM